MIMSTISSPSTQREIAAGGVVHVVMSALKRYWVAYTSWRMEQLTIARLRAMSDRELKDIGLVRSQIEFAARGDQRDRVLSRRS
jgi:uncharacterized protein YjiS (DUF1127 family)